MRKILVPLDGSLESESVLCDAVRLLPPGGEIHLLHVVPPATPPTGGNPAASLEFAAKAEDYLDRVRAGLPEFRGLNHVLIGEPADRILKLALELNIDLLAMTTHARRGMTRWFLGSVAEAVVRGSQLPVLLRKPGTAGRVAPLRRILVPLDEFESSEAILDVLKPWAAEWKTELVLLHVRPSVHDPAPQWAMPEPIRSAAGHYRQLADRMEDENLMVWPLVAEGEAAMEILRKASELDVDLIAMSAHGRRGLRRMLFGSVAQDVLAGSERPVLLLRARKGVRDD